MFASCVAERETGSTAEPFGLRALWRAYKVCRKGKRAARDTQGYEARLQRDVRSGKLANAEATHLQTLCRVLLQSDPTAGVRQRGAPSRFALMPSHKRLGAVGPTSGLPIGNLTSQFFANVYLNELDQFVKHQLRCRWYVRYVDDFVLLHADPIQLLAWRDQTVAFLAERLGLRLKALADPHPLGQGTDFLGYVLRPGYRLVRRRVVRRMQVCLQAFERQHVRRTARGVGLDLPVPARNLLRAQLASFCAHLGHAQSLRLWLRVQRRFAWLGQVFYLPAEPVKPTKSPKGLQPRWACTEVPGNLVDQYRALHQLAPPSGRLLMQVGRNWMLPGPVLPGLPAGQATQRPGLGPCTEWPLMALPALRHALQRRGLAHAVAAQTGHYATGFKRRTLVAWWTPWLGPGPTSAPISTLSNLGDLPCL